MNSLEMNKPQTYGDCVFTEPLHIGDCGGGPTQREECLAWESQGCKPQEKTNYGCL